MVELEIQAQMTQRIPVSEIRSHLFGVGSGLRELTDRSAIQEDLKSDASLWLQCMAIVISSASAAKALYDLAQIIKAKGTKNADASRKESRQLVPGVDGELQDNRERLIIVVNGVAYRIDRLDPAAIERLLVK